MFLYFREKYTRITISAKAAKGTRIQIVNRSSFDDALLVKATKGIVVVVVNIVLEVVVRRDAVVMTRTVVVGAITVVATLEVDAVLGPVVLATLGIVVMTGTGDEEKTARTPSRGKAQVICHCELP